MPPLKLIVALVLATILAVFGAQNTQSVRCRHGDGTSAYAGLDSIPNSNG